MRALAAFVITVTLIAAVPGRAAASTPLVYVALGDSTAAGVGAEHGGGYPDRLARKLAAAGVPVRLVNLGVPGATADDLRRSQLPRAQADAPALVTVGIGLNDLARGRPLADFARDLEIVADALARAKAVVILSELPDVSRAPSPPGGASPAAVARRLAAYNAVIRRTAERHGFVVGELEVATRRAFARDPSLLASDGFHPSASGYELWADALLPAAQQGLAPRVQARRASPAAAR